MPTLGTPPHKCARARHTPATTPTRLVLARLVTPARGSTPHLSRPRPATRCSVTPRCPHHPHYQAGAKPLPAITPSIVDAPESGGTTARRPGAAIWHQSIRCGGCNPARTRPTRPPTRCITGTPRLAAPEAATTPPPPRGSYRHIIVPAPPGGSGVWWCPSRLQHRPQGGGAMVPRIAPRRVHGQRRHLYCRGGWPRGVCVWG